MDQSRAHQGAQPALGHAQVAGGVSGTSVAGDVRTCPGSGAVQCGRAIQRRSTHCKRCAQKGPRRVDMTGAEAHQRVVLGPAEDRAGRPVWRVRCLLCARKAVVRRDTFQKSPCTCSSRLPDQHVLTVSLLAGMRAGARLRGVEWRLSIEDVARLTSLPCSYCGGGPANLRGGARGRSRRYSGIDRLDNERGYVPGNVTPCCWICNRAKGSLSVKEFLAWLDRASAYRRTAQ